MNFLTGIWDWFKGKRTYVLAAGGIVATWWGVYTGSIALHDALEITWAALFGSAIRAGVSNDVKGTGNG